MHTNLIKQLKQLVFIFHTLTINQVSMKELRTMKELNHMTSTPAFMKHNPKKWTHRLVTTVLLLLALCIAAGTSSAMEYNASDVDTPPKIVRQMPVKYPADAKKNGITGKVIVRCLIGVNGKAAKLEIVESDPEGFFDSSALKSLKYWQFRPGIKNGELVATWVKVPFKFE